MPNTFLASGLCYAHTCNFMLLLQVIFSLWMAEICHTQYKLMERLFTFKNCYKISSSSEKSQIWHGDYWPLALFRKIFVAIEYPQTIWPFKPYHEFESDPLWKDNTCMDKHSVLETPYHLTNHNDQWTLFKRIHKVATQEHVTSTRRTV